MFLTSRIETRLSQKYVFVFVLHFKRNSCICCLSYKLLPDLFIYFIISSKKQSTKQLDASFVSLWKNFKYPYLAQLINILQDIHFLILIIQGWGGIYFRSFLSNPSLMTTQLLRHYFRLKKTNIAKVSLVTGHRPS